MILLDSLMARLGLNNRSLTLGHNFRRYGPEFETYDFDMFVRKARKFYQTARESDDPRYSMRRLSRGRMAVDFNGEIRGIFDADGAPLAFFKPDYRALGYGSRSRELEDFRAGKSQVFV